MGLIFYQPEHEKVTLKVIDALDSVHEKYLEMISNDNDFLTNIHEMLRIQAAKFHQNPSNNSQDMCLKSWTDRQTDRQTGRQTDRQADNLCFFGVIV